MVGVIEWTNGNPVLDGMQAFNNADLALEYIEKLVKLEEHFDIKSKYTIIDIVYEDGE